MIDQVLFPRRFHFICVKFKKGTLQSAIFTGNYVCNYFCDFYEIKCTCSISIQSFKKKNHVGFVVCVLFERVYVKKPAEPFQLDFQR